MMGSLPLVSVYAFLIICVERSLTANSSPGVSVCTFVLVKQVKRVPGSPLSLPVSPLLVHEVLTLLALLVHLVTLLASVLNLLPLIVHLAAR